MLWKRAATGVPVVSRRVSLLTVRPDAFCDPISTLGCGRSGEKVISPVTSVLHPSASKTRASACTSTGRTPPSIPRQRAQLKLVQRHASQRLRQVVLPCAPRRQPLLSGTLDSLLTFVAARSLRSAKCNWRNVSSSATASTEMASGPKASCSCSSGADIII
jgi:hypothetical protein